MSKITIDINRADIMELKVIGKEVLRKDLYEAAKRLVEDSAGADTFYYCNLLINEVKEMISTNPNIISYEVDIEFEAIKEKTDEFSNVLNRLLIGI